MRLVCKEPPHDPKPTGVSKLPPKSVPDGRLPTPRRENDNHSHSTPLSEPFGRPRRRAFGEARKIPQTRDSRGEKALLRTNRLRGRRIVRGRGRGRRKAFSLNARRRFRKELGTPHAVRALWETHFSSALTNGPALVHDDGAYQLQCASADSGQASTHRALSSSEEARIHLQPHEGVCPRGPCLSRGVWGRASSFPFKGHSNDSRHLIPKHRHRHPHGPGLRSSANISPANATAWAIKSKRFLLSPAPASPF